MELQKFHSKNKHKYPEKVDDWYTDISNHYSEHMMVHSELTNRLQSMGITNGRVYQLLNTPSPFYNPQYLVLLLFAYKLVDAKHKT